MSIFVKASALALIVSVLYQMVSGRNKEIGTLLLVLGSCVILITAVSYLEPVFAFIRKLQTLGKLNNEMLEILLKSVGIGLLAEISVLVCNDMGNASMGKTLQILATAAISWLSLPMLNSLLDLIGNLLGEV
jgi:stage III sporulation protein AD